MVTLGALGSAVFTQGDKALAFAATIRHNEERHHKRSAVGQMRAVKVMQGNRRRREKYKYLSSVALMRPASLELKGRNVVLHEPLQFMCLHMTRKVACEMSCLSDTSHPSICR